MRTLIGFKHVVFAAVAAMGLTALGESPTASFETTKVGGFTVTAGVEGLGAGESRTLWLAWGRSADKLLYTNEIGTVTGEETATLSVTEKAFPGRDNYAKVLVCDTTGAITGESAAPIAFYVAGTGDAAPRGYKFLSYTESTGQQRLNTGINLLDDRWQKGTFVYGSEIYLRFGHVVKNNNTGIFGQRDGAYALRYYNNAFQYASGSTGWTTVLDANDTDDYACRIFGAGDKGTVKFGNIVITNETTGAVGEVDDIDLTTCNEALNLFSYNNNNQQSSYRLYELKVWMEKELKGHFVPIARVNTDGSETAGFWNMLNRTFYDNAYGAGQPFVAGEEVEVNLGAGFVDGVSRLTITGAEGEYGAPDPAYGTYDAIGNGNVIECFAPAAVTNGDDIAVCAGWKIYATEGDRSVGWELVSEGAGNVCRYVHPTDRRAKLVWLWREAPSYANVSIETDAIGAFKASLDVTGYGYEADDTLTLAFAWGRSPDALAFTNEFGTVSDFVSLSISEPAGRAIPGQTHYAKVFGLDKNGNVVCEDFELRAFYVAGTGDTAPAGYKFLDYVESTGKQHVDLGPNSNSLNDKIGTDYELRFGYWTVNPKDNTALFGQRSGAKNALQLKSNGLFEIGSVTFSAATPNDIYVFRTVDMGSSGLVDVGPVELTSETTGESVRAENVKLEPVNDNMHLFTYRPTDSRGASSYRFYSMKMWLDKVLKYYLVPAQRLEDGEVGLWEAVNKTFYVNTYDAATALPFGAGEEVELKIGAGTVLPESTLIVTGTALGVAGLDPTYGTYAGIPAGATFPCSAPAAISDETMRSGCSGWILYTNATDSAETWLEWKRGDGNALDYTHPEGTAAKLEWQIEAKFKATVSAADGGQITIDGGEPTSAWSGWMDAGEVHAIVPVAPDGASFAYWQGNMPVEQETDSPLALTLDGVKTVTAHFMTGTVARWKGSASNTSASKADNWADGVLPTDGAKIVLGGGATGMTWDLKTVTPGSWWQMANYGQTVTFQTTFEGEGYPVLNIGGDVLLESGTWTHTGNPTQKQNNDPRSIYRISVDATGDFTVGANAKIDVMGRGYVDHRYGSDSNVLFYGSIVCPTNYGMATIRQTAPGAVRLVVGGEFHLDGLVSASSEQPNENSDLAATGGSIWITAGTMSGSGAIKANAGYTTKNANKTNVGSGGRISLMLTEPGADFSDFHATVTAWGAIIPGSGHSMYAKAGTIYWQTGDEQFGRGTVVVANDPESLVSEADLSPNTWLLPRQWCDPKELKYAKLVIGAKSGVTLTGDLEVRDLVLEADTSALDLAGYKLRVHSAFHRYPTGHVTNAGEPTMKGKNFRNVVWSQPLALIVR